jgi:hypothetical protein
METNNVIQKKANDEAAVPKTIVVASVKREKKNTGRALMIEKRVKKPLNKIEDTNYNSSRQATVWITVWTYFVREWSVSDSIHIIDRCSKSNIVNKTVDMERKQTSATH